MATRIIPTLRRMTASPITSSSLVLRTHQSTTSLPPFSLRSQSTSAQQSTAQLVGAAEPPSTSSNALNINNVRLPRAVQAAYLRPLRREAQYSVPSADLQLRSYSIRNIEFFSDFAMRAAYYLKLPAYGPVPLPRIIERWTVPKGHFIHKKSQENFERKTFRRLIQIKDGHPETVEIWLAFLQKHAYYGIGMKANVWNYEKLELGETMDKRAMEMKGELDQRWALLGLEKGATSIEQAIEAVNKESFRTASGGAPAVLTGNE